MKTGTKEHYEIMNDFERDFAGNRFDKEPKSLWAQKSIYCDGQVNQLFLAYRLGYSNGKSASNT